METSTKAGTTQLDRLDIVRWIIIYDLVMFICRLSKFFSYHRSYQVGGKSGDAQPSLGATENIIRTSASFENGYSLEI